MKLRSTLCLILALSLALSGCDRRTTLDRVAAVLSIAASAYQLQLDQLKNQGVIDAEKHERLKKQSDAIKTHVDDLGKLISGFQAIAPGDVAAILGQIDLIAAAVESALSDSAWFGAGANLDALRALRWIRVTLATTSAIVGAIFPPVKPGAFTVQSVKPVKPKNIKFDLPPLR